MRRKAKEKIIHEHQSLNFPPGFLWGAATSAHQVEGNNQHNDWWRWEHQKRNRERSGLAADHYHRYQQDFDLAKQLGQNAHRISIEWSRLEPHEGEWDPHELEHYKNVLADLKAKGFKVFLTLNHFTLPVWLADMDGWENRRSIYYFERYVRLVVEKFAPYVDVWVTINEPMIYATQSYILGKWPPEKKSLWAAHRVVRNLARAHKRAYKVIHELLDQKGDRPQVGIANSLISYYVYRKHSFIDFLYFKISDFVWNHSFYFLTKGTHDYLGINYYIHQRIKRDRGRLFQFFFDVRSENRELSDLGWEIYPQGLFDILQDMNEYRLPIYITENGIATLNDDKRARFLVSYLKEVYHAIQSGIDIRGYFYWSLIDNFEWEKGFSPRFGLVHIDYDTMKRQIKPSATVYQRICLENSINHDLLRFIGHLMAP